MEDIKGFMNLDMMFRTSPSTSVASAKSNESSKIRINNDEESLYCDRSKKCQQDRNRAVPDVIGGTICQQDEEVAVFLDNVTIIQKTSCAQIAERVWPAAGVLANFVVNFYKQGPNIADSTTYPHDFEGNGYSEKTTNNNNDGGTNLKNPGRVEEDQKECLHDLWTLLHNSQKSESDVHGHLQNMVGDETAQTSFDVNKIIEQKIHIMELGAGVGLTGIKIAIELPARVVLTDLPEAIPLLSANIAVNCTSFRLGCQSAIASPLPWGCYTLDEDSGIRQRANKLFFAQALSRMFVLDEWYSSRTDDRNKECIELDYRCEVFSQKIKKSKILLLAADCVYFEELHRPLEEMLTSILSVVAEGSICLIAGTRRWKRDNNFYSKLGRRTRTMTHSLECVCVHEEVKRVTVDCGVLYDSRRDVMRVYAVRWRQRHRQARQMMHV